MLVVRDIELRSMRHDLDFVGKVHIKRMFHVGFDFKECLSFQGYFAAVAFKPIGIADAAAGVQPYNRTVWQYNPRATAGRSDGLDDRSCKSGLAVAQREVGQSNGRA